MTTRIMELVTLSLKGRKWEPIGPSPLSRDLHFNGLVSSIAISPSNPRVICIGTGGGGMWKSIDEGFSWRPLFDRQLSLGVGEPAGIAIDPNNSNILYVGTSNRINREPAPAGLFKSTDGGQSWIRLGSDYPFGNTGNAKQFFEQNIDINVVIVDPANTMTLYLASNRGVFVSTDGGLNWTQGTTPTGNLTGDARSLVLDTSSTGSRILYAGISMNGVFRSNDGGLNWTPILDQTTPAIQAAIGSGGIGKIVVDIAPSISPPNPLGVQVIYVSLQGTGGCTRSCRYLRKYKSRGYMVTTSWN